MRRARGTRGVLGGQTSRDAISELLRKHRGDERSQDDIISEIASHHAEVVVKADYKPTPTAKRIHACNSNMVVAIGPVGCGKSFMSWRHVFGVVMAMPAQNGVVRARTLAMRNTLEQTVDTMLPSFFEALPASWRADWSASKKTMYVDYSMRKGGEQVRVEHEIIFRAAERAEDERKFKSLNVTNVLASEFSMLNFDLMMTGFTRTGRFPTGMGSEQVMNGLFESNNFSRSHKMHGFFIERDGVDEMARSMELSPDGFMTVFRYPGGRTKEAENLENLPKDYYKINALVKGEQWARVNIDNEPGVVGEGRQCYRFDPDVHVDEKILPDPFLPIHLGVDLGRDSAYVMTQERRDGSIRVVDCYFVDNLPLVTACPEAADYFASRYPNREWRWAGVWADPGGKAEWQNDDVKPIDILERAFRRLGCRTMAAGTNDVNTRIEVVNDLFQRTNHTDFKPRLMISGSGRCQALVDSCMAYHWAELKEWNKAGAVRYQEKPMKDHYSHLAEALQYAALRNTSRSIVGGPLAKSEQRGGGKAVPIDIDLIRA